MQCSSSFSKLRFASYACVWKLYELNYKHFSQQVLSIQVGSDKVKRIGVFCDVFVRLRFFFPLSNYQSIYNIHHLLVLSNEREKEQSDRSKRLAACRRIMFRSVNGRLSVHFSLILITLKRLGFCGKRLTINSLKVGLLIL